MKESGGQKISEPRKVGSGYHTPTHTSVTFQSFVMSRAERFDEFCSVTHTKNPTSTPNRILRIWHLSRWRSSLNWTLLNKSRLTTSNPPSVKQKRNPPYKNHHLYPPYFYLIIWIFLHNFIVDQGKVILFTNATLSMQQPAITTNLKIEKWITQNMISRLARAHWTLQSEPRSSFNIFRFFLFAVGCTVFLCRQCYTMPVPGKCFRQKHSIGEIPNFSTILYNIFTFLREQQNWLHRY